LLRWAGAGWVAAGAAVGVGAVVSTTGVTADSDAGVVEAIAAGAVGVGRAGVWALAVRTGAGVVTDLAAVERVVRFTDLLVVAVAGSSGVAAVSTAGAVSGAGTASIVGGGGVTCGIGSVTGCAS
jgi:hypothetical protein